MTRAFFVAILLACAAAAVNAAETSETSETRDSAEEPDVDDDTEKNVAAFMIVVEHPDGWRCSGSLVSLRTALTSAWCVRGRGALPARELWALAAAAVVSDAAAARIHGARRVCRLAVATGADAELADVAEPDVDATWRGGAMDLAVVELEEPFGSAARSRPIFMATTGGECTLGAGAQCHVSRSVLRPGSPRRSLRIVAAELTAPETCDAAAAHWSAIRDRAFCLVGPELCDNDWGGGVVCGGKLCGVVSRSVRRADGASEAPEGREAGGGEACGDIHGAQSLAGWRRFLHCAHTLRACGRGGDCADLCVERRLIEAPAPEPEPEPAPEPEPEPPASEAPAQTTAITTSPSTPMPPSAFPRTRSRHSSPDTHQTRPTRPTNTNAMNHPTHTSSKKVPAPVRTSAALEPVDAPPSSMRPAFEFEPNRADFKAAPARSTRVYLKAGEYGDNAADYGGEEPAPAHPSASEDPPTHTPAPPGPSPTTSLSSPPGGAPSKDPPPAERRAAAKHGTDRSLANRVTVPKLFPILLLLLLNIYLQAL